MKHSVRRITTGLFCLALLLGPAVSHARETPPTPQQTEPKEADLSSHGHYVNKDGAVVHAPAKSVSGQVPAGASAKCRDGSYSFSRHHSGTCSHHGGVGQWL